jgi:hypothetical protein
MDKNHRLSDTTPDAVGVSELAEVGQVTDEPSHPQSRTDWIEIEFICTKRGNHRRPYRLLQAMVGPGPDGFDPLTDYTSFPPADRQSMFGGGLTYDEFHCAGCGGNFRIMHEKFVELLRRLHREGSHKYDVSYL